ncbi:ABC transporter ATP-binding protein [candidate division CSSED10-310 bacterium]|uniref:ABC transporter ATP-binding protein n=1 Tax=candidate division CSSED10-310 bacterium TaxID=2855610 RepID=A0ABV6YXV0_UNCC1
MASIVEVKQLTKIYRDKERGEVRAADEVSFNCARGEIFGILGPNGAGKTTTLRMLSTVIRPTTGTALINEYDIVEQPQQVRASIGFLSSTTGLFPRMTPLEILNYFGRLHHVPAQKLKQQVEKLVSIFEMDQFMNVRSDRLSTGMKQKVSIGRTLIHDPPVLFFDEPTVGLDILVASTMMKFIQNCRREKRAVIFSTHTMSEAEKLCDRLAIIHQGRIHAIGSLKELQARTGKRFLEDIFIDLIRNDGGINE